MVVLHEYCTHHSLDIYWKQRIAKPYLKYIGMILPHSLEEAVF